MNKKTEQRFRQIMQEIDYYTNTINSLSWDMRVCLPPDAAEYRGDTISFLSSKLYEIKTSKEMGDLVSELEKEKIDDFILSRMVKRASEEYHQLTNTPKEIYSEYMGHTIKTELVWQEARAKNDYAMVMPYMIKEFELKKQLVQAYGFKDVVTGLMNEWQKGLTREQIDKLFEDLKKVIIPLVGEIKETGKIYTRENLKGFFPHDKQIEFCKEMAGTVGYNFNSGRLDESAHPYTTPNYRKDIRLTTRVFENDFTNAAISTMHEGGHAIHWQNMSPKLDGTTLNVASSLPIDESQSRFNENILGRSLEFWEYFTPVAKKYFPDMKWDPLYIYRNLNGISYNPRRLDSDELTYNLHVIIRYECEKLLFDGAIKYEDLPRVWNEKTKQYIGVTPKNDTEGLLQDMHWFSGYICYFQSYVLGNCYDGHWLYAMKKEIPDMFAQVKKGQFANIIGWLKNNVQQYAASLTPEEVLKQATGETLSAQHYIDYIVAKYRGIYEI